MKAPGAATAPLVAALSVLAVAGAVAVFLAPAGARGWAVAVVVTAWVVLAVALAVAHTVARRTQRAASARNAEAERLKTSLTALEADTAHTADVALPALLQLVRGGVPADEALGRVPLPRGPRQRKLLHVLAATVEGQEQQTAALRTEGTRIHDELGRENARLREELHALTSEVERFTRETLPSVAARLREGESGATVQAEVYLPDQPLLRASVEAVLRELALSERRALAAQTASAKALSRVQAKSVSMLADLRSMQERHSEEVFGDLLKLDHSTSQLGLMTDRLALLMGGRPSRAWNRPIVMESILRGAVGRIAAYQRVRLHCSSNVAISGFAAEGVMHLLAELMDNAANFSPPIDEVHVYVEERGTGIVVTIEDSGLKMADAAMRRAADSVAGRLTDLAALQGTRLGLAVVGQLALKHRISVNYRPSSRGGTGVVVLLPRHLIAQESRESHAVVPSLREAAAAATPTPAAVPAPAPTGTLTPEPVSPEPATPVPAPVTPPTTPVPATPALPETVAPAAPMPAPAPATPSRPEAPAPASPATDPLVVRPREPQQPAARPAQPPSTPGGLPVRTPGRTMGEAERGRHRGAPAPTSAANPRGDTPRATPPRTAGQQFGAFHRGRRPQGNAAAAEQPDAGTVPPPPPSSAP
ncbi:ATP-binding protein [Streptomyces griseus]|uniref:ATP-binding protein n=1 Tax=Streptomyces globisporus TaxID=1908 RepID=UPI0005C86DBD|nr:ATP-binding protein [Streptomyces globisporus]AWL87992.1 sensor histidine kinase [Streptomyces globisporus]PPA41864.1 ATP-binding protein [Streptomyces griseus]RAN19176.1 histidine kinase [Streptomyces badius]RAN27087.1 histidine kinase [Streptomyces badius]